VDKSENIVFIWSVMVIIHLYCIVLRCRCFKDVKTAAKIFIAPGMSTRVDLEISLESSGSVRPNWTYAECLSSFWSSGRT